MRIVSLVFVVSLLFADVGVAESVNLVKNPSFEIAGKQDDAAADWTAAAPDAALRRSSNALTSAPEREATPPVSAPREITVLATSIRTYRWLQERHTRSWFAIGARASTIPTAACWSTWCGAEKAGTTGSSPIGRRPVSGSRGGRSFTCPGGAVLRVMLLLRIEGPGAVYFDDVEVRETKPPPRRVAKVASCPVLPTQADRIERANSLVARIAKAAEAKCDIICLTEALNAGNEPILKIAEPIPGPMYNVFSQAARNHQHLCHRLHLRAGQRLRIQYGISPGSARPVGGQVSQDASALARNVPGSSPGR